MLRSLSSYLQRQAEQRFDGRIPQERQNFIKSVAAYERDMRREAGPLEVAYSTLKAAQDELHSRHVELRLAQHRAGAGGQERAELIKARAEALDAADWLDQCGLQYRNALRQSAADAAEGRAA